MSARTIAAIQPGPWTPLTLAGGLSAQPAAYTPAARLWLDMVQLRGAVTGTFATGGTTIATLPVGSRPASQVSVPVGFDAGAAGRIVITTTGVITALPAATATVLFLGLAAFSLV